MEILSTDIIYNLKFPCITPFQLQLHNQEFLFIEKIIRLAPKRRLIAYGTWQNKPIVAKLFFHKKRAKISCEKDAAGIQILLKQQIITPAIILQGQSFDQQIHVLLLERITQEKTIEEIWLNKQSVNEFFPLLYRLINELATQHQLGIKQDDLHLKNYLLSQNIIYTLDGANINQAPHALDKKTSLQNLALFLMQFGTELAEHIESLFHYYAKLRQWTINKEDTNQLFILIKQCYRTCWQRFKIKILSECSDFAYFKNHNLFAMLERTHAYQGFLNLIKNPDGILNQPSTQLLQQDRTTITYHIILDNHQYNLISFKMQNIWQRLSYFWRPTQAYRLWMSIYKSKTFGNPVNQLPIALIEKKRFGFLLKSYIVMT